MPNNWQCRTVALDPSKGAESKFGDYSAFVKLLVGMDGTLYIDAHLDRCHTSVIVERALEIQQEFRADGFAVEINQFQSMLADEMFRRGGELGIYMPVFGYHNTVNKLVRICGLTPYLARGKLRFKGGSAGAQLLVEQLKDFPLADFDDAPDSLELAIRMAGDLLNSARNDPPPPDTISYVWT